MAAPLTAYGRNLFATAAAVSRFSPPVCCSDGR